jgi:hypothetical protein
LLHRGIDGIGITEVGLDEDIQAQAGFVAVHAYDSGTMGTQGSGSFGADARGDPGHDYRLVGQLHAGFPIQSCLCCWRKGGGNQAMLLLPN